MIEALSARGFDSEGRQRPGKNKTDFACLEGSLQLLCTDALVTAKFTKVQQEAQAVVDAIIRRRGSSPTHKAR